MQGFPFQPEQASSIAKSVDQLYFFLTAVTLFFTALIFSIIFYFMIKPTGNSRLATSNSSKGSLVEVCRTAISLIVASFVWVHISSQLRPCAFHSILMGKQWMEGQAPGREPAPGHAAYHRPPLTDHDFETPIHDFLLSRISRRGRLFDAPWFEAGRHVSSLPRSIAAFLWE